jgi:hypothetical protein
LGLIETSVVRVASKIPLKVTSTLKGPFSTLDVAGLLLLEEEEAAAAGASGLEAGFSTSFWVSRKSRGSPRLGTINGRAKAPSTPRPSPNAQLLGQRIAVLT